MDRAATNHYPVGPEVIKSRPVGRDTLWTTNQHLRIALDVIKVQFKLRSKDGESRPAAEQVEHEILLKRAAVPYVRHRHHGNSAIMSPRLAHSEPKMLPRNDQAAVSNVPKIKR